MTRNSFLIRPVERQVALRSGITNSEREVPLALSCRLKPNLEAAKRPGLWHLIYCTKFSTISTAMKILPISQARSDLAKLVDDVDRRFNRIVLTKSGRAKAVLMSSEEFESWTETLEILSNSETMKALKEAAKDLASGKVVTHQKALKEL